ncbi:MAG: DNA-processing protein DprA [Flavobacteriales bacterium]
MHYFRQAQMNEELLYQIALKKLDGIGATRAKKLVSYCGGVREVFEAPKKKLLTVPGIGQALVSKLNRESALELAEPELKFIEKNNVRPIFYLDKDYPKRLKHCEDSPLLLYISGNMNLNVPKVVSIVGTRNATSYGAKITERLIDGLKAHDALVVSGLALGIDIIAHRAAVQAGLQTVGVLGNSLDRIYPHQNKAIAEKMKPKGGLITEFESGTKPDRENFPQRNRIVAGMADVTIVIESAVKGGSMITAQLATGYNRDVMAVPGAIDAPWSSGCNHLIKTNKAHMIEDIEDLEYLMGWEREEKGESQPQKQLFVELNEEERKVYELLKEINKESLDNISLSSGMPVSKTSTLLLELEFKGVVKSLPGKVYSLV